MDGSFDELEIRRRVAAGRLRDERVVIDFEFSDAPREVRDFWPELNEDVVDLCEKDPGYPVDLKVQSDRLTLTREWPGKIREGGALADDSRRVPGPGRPRRAFPRWLALSLFAKVERPS